MYQPINISNPDNVDDDISLSHILTESGNIDEYIFTEAVFKNTEKLKKLEEIIQKIKEEMARQYKEDKSKNFNIEKFWKNTSFKELENTFSDIFGFKNTIIDVIDDHTMDVGKKQDIPEINAYTDVPERYPIDGLITDKGFYDKTKSIELYIAISLWWFKECTAKEILGVILHEIGHNIDPAIVDINYTGTKILTDYITDRNEDWKKGKQNKFIEKIRKNFDAVGALVTFWILWFVLLCTLCLNAAKNEQDKEDKENDPIVLPKPPNFENWWKRTFGDKDKYKAEVEKKYLQFVYDQVKKQSLKFNRQNYAEAFADNFARMYGYGAPMLSALNKLDKFNFKEALNKSWLQKDHQRRKFIIAIFMMQINDSHKTDMHRIENLIEEYEADIKNPKTPKKIKAKLEEDKKELEDMVNAIKKNPKEFKDKVNKAIINALEDLRKNPKVKSKVEPKTESVEDDSDNISHFVNFKPIIKNTWREVAEDYEKLFSGDFITEEDPEFEFVIDYINSLDLDDENFFEAKSTTPLKYCYRIGFDEITGLLTAVEFNLEPDKINYVGDKRMTQGIAPVNKYLKDIHSEEELDKALDQMHNDALIDTRKNIRKKGCIDFRTEDLKVLHIFSPLGKNRNECRLVPIFGHNAQKFVKDLMHHPDIKNIRTKFRKPYDFVKSAEIAPYFKKYCQENNIKGEYYKVGMMGGKDKYKTTKLIWNPMVFSSLQYSPRIRGQLPEMRNEDQMKSQARYSAVNAPEKLTPEELKQFKKTDKAYSKFSKFSDKAAEVEYKSGLTPEEKEAKRTKYMAKAKKFRDKGEKREEKFLNMLHK